MRNLLHCLLVVTLLAALAQPTFAISCSEFEGQIKRTYGFRPSQLDSHAQEMKSKQMDEIWTAVHADPAVLGPCLRGALTRNQNDGWFQFDGSQLLVSIDSSRIAKELLYQALSRVDLDDVDLRSWVASASTLALEGFDTSSLAKRWLSYGKAEYFLPEHGAYRVDRENGAMFLFGTLEERLATPALVELSRVETGEVKEIAVWLLMSQATPEALEAISHVNTEGLSAKTVSSLRALQHKPVLIAPRKPAKTSRAEFLAAFAPLLKGDERAFDRLVASIPDGERDLVAVATEADLEMLRKVRRYYIAKNTQHAIE